MRISHFLHSTAKQFRIRRFRRFCDSRRLSGALKGKFYLPNLRNLPVEIKFLTIFGKAESRAEPKERYDRSPKVEDRYEKTCRHNNPHSLPLRNLTPSLFLGGNSRPRSVFPFVFCEDPALQSSSHTCCKRGHIHSTLRPLPLLTTAD